MNENIEALSTVVHIRLKQARRLRALADLVGIRRPVSLAAVGEDTSQLWHASMAASRQPVFDQEHREALQVIGLGGYVWPRHAVAIMLAAQRLHEASSTKASQLASARRTNLAERLGATGKGGNPVCHFFITGSCPECPSCAYSHQS